MHYNAKSEMAAGFFNLGPLTHSGQIGSQVLWVGPKIFVSEPPLLFVLLL